MSIELGMESVFFASTENFLSSKNKNKKVIYFLGAYEMCNIFSFLQMYMCKCLLPIKLALGNAHSLNTLNRLIRP